GFSVLNPATGRAVVEWFPPRERGIAMGVKQTGLTLGGLAAALTLPLIARAWSWRHALATAGLLSLASATLVAIFYRSQPAHPRRARRRRVRHARAREHTAAVARPSARLRRGRGRLRVGRALLRARGRDRRTAPRRSAHRRGHGLLVERHAHRPADLRARPRS